VAGRAPRGNLGVKLKYDNFGTPLLSTRLLDEPVREYQLDELLDLLDDVSDEAIETILRRYYVPSLLTAHGAEQLIQFFIDRIRLENA
jgi:hypothetical protein